MDTLTELGRHEICKRVGINNPNSIFVKDKDAFIDRMNLYKRFYNIDIAVDLYKKELEKYETEKDYVDDLYRKEVALYKTCGEMLRRCEIVASTLGSSVIVNSLYCTNQYETFYRKTDNLCVLRIGFESPVYEAFKFLVTSFYKCELNFHEFVYELTESEFLASANDLDINKFKSPYIRNTLIAQMNLLSEILVNFLCPKYLNSKSAIYVKSAEAHFESTTRKTPESLYRIADTLLNNDEYSLDANIELFTLKPLDKQHTIFLKDSVIASNKDERLDIFGYDEYSLIRYLRKIYNEPISVYDNYMSNGDMEMMITLDKEIDWL